MQMQHRLSGTFAAVVHYAIAVVKSLLLCNFGYCLKDMGNNGAVFGRYVIAPLYMLFGYNENVYGCLRREILKRNYRVILINLLRRDFSVYDCTENAVHEKAPF